MNIKLVQDSGLPNDKQLSAISFWIMVFADDVPQPFAGVPYGEQLLSRRRQLGSDKPDTRPITLDLPTEPAGRVAYACIKPSLSSFELLTLARKLVAVHDPFRPKRLGIIVGGFERDNAERVAETVMIAALAAHIDMPQFKSVKPKTSRLTKLALFGVRSKDRFRTVFAEARGNALARSLSTLPANMLRPADYLTKIRQLARRHKWKFEFYNTQALKRKKAGAFLAVAQGSPTDDAGIVRLRYTPARGKSKPKIALVGKGICYDTGGTNLKPASYMFGMHEDMQGSAVALGILSALTELAYERPVECWLALAMNHIGPKAYKPNDVVTACDGTTIEIVHTDAEGRMVLADTLALASGQKPKLIIDFATLTGACVNALGTAYSGVFTNRQAWMTSLIDAGQRCGERVWPFPLDEDFDSLIESDIADIKQCSRENNADHIVAARFLQRFVKHKTAWIHMDLASGNCKGGLAHIPTDTTGFGVRYTLNLLCNEELI